jgi:hypothetical protein
MQLTSLEAKCVTYIQRNAQGIFDRPDLSELPQQLLLDILGSEQDTITYSEEDLFDVIVRWCESNKGAGSLTDAM